MFNQVRDLARRPVYELPAGLVLVVCALVLVAGAVLIASTSGDPARPAERADAETQEITLYDAPDDEVDEPADPLAVRYPDAPSEDTHGLGTDYPPLKASDAALIRTSAREFLRGYLPYSYGHGNVAQIDNATREFLAQLERNQPRPPADLAARHPRIVLVHMADGGLSEPAEVVALIDDEQTRYTLRLRMKRTGFGEWSATDVGPS